MKITVNSVTSGEVTAKYREPMLALERQLQECLNGSYEGGVESLAFIAVSVSDDEAENQNFADDFNKSGYFKSPLSGERIKYLSFAYAITPQDAQRLSDHDLLSNFIAGILLELQTPRVRIPKSFDLQKLISDMEMASAQITDPKQSGKMGSPFRRSGQ